MSRGDSLLGVREGVWGYRTATGWVEPSRPVDFEVRPGELVLLSGDNGSGKTTILRGILGLVPLRSGTVEWGLPRGEVGYVPQESVLDRSGPATALDVVRSGCPLRWGPGKDEAMAALAKVWLQDRRKVPFGSLSGGQRQRVLVARALVGGPKLLILDEPTVNVDAGTADQIGQLLSELQRSGLGMMITSHVKDWVTATREVTVRPNLQEVGHG